MNRLAKSALGLTGALALSLGGMSTATATEPKDDKPTVSEWFPYDDRYDIEAGFACKGEVKAHSKGSFRVHELYVNEKKGVAKLKVEFKDWSYSTYSHRKVVKKVVRDHDGDKKVIKVVVKKKVKINEGGDAVIKVNTKNGDAYGHHEGQNTFWGKGVYGLVHTKGYVKTKFTDFQTPEEGVTILKAEHAVELCKKLGTKPVWGKNPPVEEESKDMAASSRS